MDTSIVPQDKHEAVTHALRTVFSTDALDELIPLRGGMSTALVCRIAVGGRSALLRVEAVRDQLRDPVRQYACMGIAAAAGVAPPLWFADPETGVAIMDYVAERPRTEYPGGTPGLVLEIGGLIARLQATPAFPSLVDYLDGVDAVIGSVLAMGVIDERACAEHLAGYREIRDAYPRLANDALVSSHNDPNPGNLLYDGRRVWMVDWEAAFASDPHVDPAIVANWFGVEGDAENALLHAVFGEVDEARRARFLLMRQICNMFLATMMLSLVGSTRAPGTPPITDLEGPDLATVRGGLKTGEVQIGRTDGQLLFAKAALRAVRDTARGPAFAAAARLLASRG